MSEIKIEPYRSGYKVDGEYFPRVTTVIDVLAKPGLVIWARREALKIVRHEFRQYEGQVITLAPDFLDDLIARADREPDRQKDEAADIGTRAHAAIHDIILGKEPPVSSDILPCVEGFLGWKESSGIEIDGGEIRVASKKHKFAGTLDGKGQRSDSRLILDWKTSKAIYPAHVMQVAAYCKAWEEMYGEKVMEAWICRFPKNPQEEVDGIPDPKWVPFEARKIVDIDFAFSLFLNAKGLYDGLKQQLFV